MRNREAFGDPLKIRLTQVTSASAQIRASRLEVQTASHFHRLHGIPNWRQLARQLGTARVVASCRCPTNGIEAHDRSGEPLACAGKHGLASAAALRRQAAL
jgi:hypothetical protein